MKRLTLHHGDAIPWLDSLPTACADVLLTDPPYSSGGFVRGDRMQSTAAKYQRNGSNGMQADFTGDNRDQRSWTAWCLHWLASCRRILKPGGYALVFVDWRQLPALTDAFQGGGLVWRGLVNWDKTEAARAAHKGYFRAQCEYLVWGSNGPLPVRTDAGPFPGCYRVMVRPWEKKHMTAKPYDLVRRLLACARPGETVLDPFMGSGIIGRAALDAGCGFLGCELDAHSFATARQVIGGAIAC